MNFDFFKKMYLIHDTETILNNMETETKLSSLFIFKKIGNVDFKKIFNSPLLTPTKKAILIKHSREKNSLIDELLLTQLNSEDLWFISTNIDVNLKIKEKLINLPKETREQYINNLLKVAKCNSSFQHLVIENATECLMHKETIMDGVILLDGIMDFGNVYHVFKKGKSLNNQEIESMALIRNWLDKTYDLKKVKSEEVMKSFYKGKKIIFDLMLNGENIKENFEKYIQTAEKVSHQALNMMSITSWHSIQNSIMEKVLKDPDITQAVIIEREIYFNYFNIDYDSEKVVNMIDDKMLQYLLNYEKDVSNRIDKTHSNSWHYVFCRNIEEPGESQSAPVLRVEYKFNDFQEFHSSFYGWMLIANKNDKFKETLKENEDFYFKYDINHDFSGLYDKEEDKPKDYHFLNILLEKFGEKRMLDVMNNRVDIIKNTQYLYAGGAIKEQKILENYFIPLVTSSVELDALKKTNSKKSAAKIL